MEALTPNASLVDKVYLALLEAICTGELPAGTRLNQDEIAEKLNVSRQPLNSAIAMLKTQRFVQDTGRRGVVVAPVDQEMFRAIYQFRTAIEPLAAQLASANMTRDAISQGRAIIERGKLDVQRGDEAAVLRADMEFHGLIYHLSANQIIQDVMTLNWRHLQRAMSEVLRTPGMSLRVWKEHDQIFSAIVAGDGETAANLMREHIANSVEWSSIAADSRLERG